jgi:hypothetical protein
VEIKKTLVRKKAVLITLLLASTIVATAIAAVYYSLLMESRASTNATDVKFVAGGDSTTAGATGYSTNGTYVMLGSIKAYPNATLTYEQAINVSNTGAVAHQFRLRHSSITNGTSAVSHFYSISFWLVAPNGTTTSTEFKYLNANGDNNWDNPVPTMNYINILASETWAVKVVTRAKAGAWNNQVATISMYLDVK